MKDSNDSILTCSIPYLQMICYEFITLFDIYQRESVLNPELFKEYADASYLLQRFYFRLAEKTAVTIEERNNIQTLISQTITKSKNQQHAESTILLNAF